MLGIRLGSSKRFIMGYTYLPCTGKRLDEV